MKLLNYLFIIEFIAQSKIINSQIVFLIYSTLPFLFCEITGSCKYASRNDFVYWLSGDIRNTPTTPVANAVIEPYVSRCTVCKTPDLSITVHSQDTVEPVCPKGYDSLWDGYSFLMVNNNFFYNFISTGLVR